jgi:hypothetical protein
MIRILTPSATVLQKGLAACPTAAYRFEPCLRQANRSLRPQSSRLGQRETLLPLPSCLEPYRLVESGGEPRLAGVARGGICADAPLAVGLQLALLIAVAVACRPILGALAPVAFVAAAPGEVLLLLLEGLLDKVAGPEMDQA